MVKMVISVLEKHKERNGHRECWRAGGNFAVLNRLVRKSLCKNRTFVPLKG